MFIYFVDLRPALDRVRLEDVIHLMGQKNVYVNYIDI